MKQSKFFVVLWQSFCLLMNLAASEYRDFVKLPVGPEGCGEIAGYENVMSCAARCQSNCSAFQFLENTKTCAVCYRFELQGLAGSRKDFYVEGTASYRNIPVTNPAISKTTFRFHFKQPIRPGVLIHFSFTFLHKDRMTADLLGGGQNIALHMDFRGRYGSYTNKIILASRVRGKWANYDPVKYRMVAGQRLEVYLLLTDTVIVGLLDDRLLPKIKYRVPVGSLKGMYFSGKVKIHEVRF